MVCFRYGSVLKLFHFGVTLRSPNTDPRQAHHGGICKVKNRGIFALTTTEFISLELITTFYGSVFVVELLTQMSKRYVGIDPKWLTLGFAAVVSLIRLISIGDFSLIEFALAAFNALLIAGASIGAFETIKGIIRRLI